MDPVPRCRAMAKKGWAHTRSEKTRGLIPRFRRVSKKGASGLPRYHHPALNYHMGPSDPSSLGRNAQPAGMLSRGVSHKDQINPAEELQRGGVVRCFPMNRVHTMW